MHAAPVSELARVRLDVRSLLARIAHRLATLRRALAHHHRDEPYWQTLGITASQAQAERAFLRPLANLLCVERAHSRARIHGRQFESLEAQAAWLAKMAHVACARTARAASLPDDATLAKLRAGALEDPA